MNPLDALRSLIAADPARMRILRQVRDLALPDCWVAAGFVRSLVWDSLHDRPASPLPADIDVIWFDPVEAALARDSMLEQALRALDGALDWSVKNQARMHERNGDPPYRSSAHAMMHWPETATAVGARIDDQDRIEILAPFGLDDLFGLVVRPSARFRGSKDALYLERIRSKNWQAFWPRLQIECASA